MSSLVLKPLSDLTFAAVEKNWGGEKSAIPLIAAEIRCGGGLGTRLGSANML